MQDIRFTDLSEGYAIVPLRGGQKNTVHGVTILVSNRVFPHFLNQHLAPVNQDVIDHIAHRFAVNFTPFTDSQDAAKKGLGFNQGIRLSCPVISDWTRRTQIHVLFQQSRKVPRRGWPGYAFVLNMNWLLRSLQSLEYPAWTGEGTRQLFTVHTGFSGGFVDTAFPITATVSRSCHQMLTNMDKTALAKAEQALTEARRWYHPKIPDGMAQIKACESGLLHLQSEPWCMTDDSNGEPGYKLYSTNVDDPVGQIVLFAGIAGVWEEIRKRQAPSA